MADSSLNGSQTALTSQWGGLSPHLIASFFVVKRSVVNNRARWDRDDSKAEVRAAITDGNVETTLNWQSPFENMGPDQKLSTFSALIQADGFSSWISQLKALFPNSDTVDSLQAKASSLEGRSNLTKLNSTQVFTGMPPLKISVTAHFRAFSDAATEVRDPMNQLMEWAVPRSIAPDIISDPKLFPSEVPETLGMKFADMLFAPIVIESIPFPLTGPRDENGVLTHASMALQLASLTAWDKDDWINARSSRNSASIGISK